MKFPDFLQIEMGSMICPVDDITAIFVYSWEISDFYCEYAGK